jgi:7-carboxy-7-deazaguanine synthase
MPKLNVYEIYTSIQGEAKFAGWPCTMVRLAQCPLRCAWCDTAYAFQGGTDFTIPELLSKIDALGCPVVELTGGEPLAQEAASHLMDELLRIGYQVLLETGGSESVAPVPKGVHIIMDLKCPGSKMSERNRWENLNELKPSDEIKLVIASRSDYDWAKGVVEKHQLSQRFTVLFSPAFGLLAPRTLAEWIVDDRLSVRLNLQLHKFIWSPRQRGV